MLSGPQGRSILAGPGRACRYPHLRVRRAQGAQIRKPGAERSAALGAMAVDPKAPPGRNTWREQLLRPCGAFLSEATATPGGASLCPGLSNLSPLGCRPKGAENVPEYPTIYITDSYAHWFAPKLWVMTRLVKPRRLRWLAAGSRRTTSLPASWKRHYAGRAATPSTCSGQASESGVGRRTPRLLRSKNLRNVRNLWINSSALLLFVPLSLSASVSMVVSLCQYQKIFMVLMNYTKHREFASAHLQSVRLTRRSGSSHKYKGSNYLRRK